MRSALSAFVLSLCFISLIHLAVQAETRTQVIVESKKGAPGQIVTIKVSVQGAPDPGVGTMQGTISYPVDILQVKDVTKIDNDNDYDVYAFSIDEAEQKIIFLVACFSRKCRSNGAIFQFSAKVIGKQDDKGPIDIVSLETFRTANEENITSPELIGGSFEVGEGGPGGCSTDPDLKAFFTFDVDDPKREVTFKDSSEAGSGCKIASWSWDFGDNKPKETIQNPKHKYDQPGCYSVKLTVTDTGGNTRDFSKTVNVAATPPKAEFEFAPKTVNAGDVVTFTYKRSDPKLDLNFLWNFGDNGTSTQENTKHIFFKSSPPPLQVTLTVTNKGDNCSATATANISVSPPQRPLVRNWPNPVSTSTKFGYSLTKEAKSGTLKIFSLAGKNVKELPLSNNSGEVSWNVPSDLPNGPYYYVVIADGSVSKAGKFVVHR